MHTEAYEFVKNVASQLQNAPTARVVEIGCREPGQVIRSLFAPWAASYVGVDAQPGDWVDVVCGGQEYVPTSKADIVVCCEVFEHTPLWRDIVRNVYDNVLAPGGILITTAAGPDRPVHGIGTDHPDQPGYYYENLDAMVLWDAMKDAGYVGVTIIEAPCPSQGGADVYAIGWKDHVAIQLQRLTTPPSTD